MPAKSIYDRLQQRDVEARIYQFRTSDEFDLKREERQLAIKLLRRRDNILKALFLFTERFLRMSLSESSIEPILEKLGHAAEVSRVYIFQNHTGKDGTLLTSQRYEWVAPGITPQQSNPELQALAWIEAGFKRWVETLGRHQIIYGHVRELPEVERSFLETQAIFSILIAPIFVGQEWWGFIGFDDCESEREWSPVEIEALKTAANIIGAAIQRQQAESALLDSEQKYRLVVENANEGIVVTQDGQLKLANPQASHFIGRTQDELRSNNFVDYIHPDDREMVIEHHRKRLAGEETPQIYSFRMIDGEGKPRWIQNNGVLVEWEGRPATLNFLLDITHRVQAGKALRESEEKYRQLFESESDAVMIFDAATLQFEDANPATLNLFGYSKEEFLTLRVEDISHEKDKTRKAVSQVINDLSDSDKVPLRYFKRKDGSVFAGEIFTGKFFAEGGKKIIGAVRDISGRMRAEDKIHGLTQELIKAQESERNRIARYLHDHVAQDLSTLKIGLGTLSYNSRDCSEETTAKISELSNILQESISAVRDLSYDLRPPAMEQLGLVRTIYQACEDFSEKNNVTVDFYAAGMNTLKLDFDTEINLFRLLQEGLNNIKKHAEADHVTIRLVASSPNIILRIEDNGSGFDVKSRLARALKERRMGLSSMEERVNLLEGKMTIKSLPSKGTKIFIEVPYKERKNGCENIHSDRG